MLLIGLPLTLIIDRVLFRVLSDRILFKTRSGKFLCNVPSNRVFFWVLSDRVFSRVLSDRVIFIITLFYLVSSRRVVPATSSVSFVFLCYHLLYTSLTFVVIRCDLLSLVVIRCPSVCRLFPYPQKSN